MAILPRERERATARRSWAHSGTARRPSATAQSRCPSRQSTSPPDPRQGRVQRDLDLVLQVQVRAAQQPEQAGQILGEQVVGQGRVGDQVACGWRHRCCGGSQECLHPHAFFAHPGWAWALRVSTQRGRLQTNPARCSAILTVSIPARWPVTP